jgi:hypothetical protein
MFPPDAFCAGWLNNFEVNPSQSTRFPATFPNPEESKNANKHISNCGSLEVLKTRAEIQIDKGGDRQKKRPYSFFKKQGLDLLTF